MSKTQFQFVPTDPQELLDSLKEKYEKYSGVTPEGGSPENLFILWAASALLAERVNINYAGSQNLPGGAEGENLDAIGEMIFSVKRPDAQAAVCTERFHISEAQATAVLIRAGTRVTDPAGALVWETVTDAYVEAGDTYTDVRVRCQTGGTVGNGCKPGEINTIVDLYDYYTKCENITASDGGTDQATDEEYFDLMRASLDAPSTAGAVGTYIYWAKSVSTRIADVVANSPSAATVAIYVLMDDGTTASEEIKKAVLEACSEDTRRPLTDRVIASDAETVDYDIKFTYYIQSGSTESAATVQKNVTEAVQRYAEWQSGALGRDINPDRLREFLVGTGVKRIDLASPVFTPLHKGREKDGETGYAKYKPQIARLGTATVTNGGYEDE